MSKDRTKAFQRELLENVGESVEIIVQRKVWGSISGVTTLKSDKEPTIVITNWKEIESVKI